MVTKNKGGSALGARSACGYSSEYLFPGDGDRHECQSQHPGDHQPRIDLQVSQVQVRLGHLGDPERCRKGLEGEVDQEAVEECSHPDSHSCSSSSNRDLVPAVVVGVVRVEMGWPPPDEPLAGGGVLFRSFPLFGLLVDPVVPNLFTGVLRG